jgi:RNA polymerase sigma-70 factor (ECF subfamily)
MPSDPQTAQTTQLFVDVRGQEVRRLAAGRHEHGGDSLHPPFDAAGRRVVASVLAVGEEARLLARAREGDLAAFAEFVRRFERRVRALLGRLLDDERDVEEAAQDTFVQAWRSLDRFRGEAAPFTWLYRIAVNEALQRARRKRVETRPLEDVPGLDTEVEPGGAVLPLPADLEAESRETLTFLAGRVRALPFDTRAPLVLRDIEGWSHEEVADALGISVAASKSRVHRARMQLRAELDAWLLERFEGRAAGERGGSAQA